MTTLNYQSGAPTLVGYRPSDDFSFSIVETPSTSGGTWSYAQNYKDSVVDNLDSYTSDNNFRVDVAENINHPGSSLSIQSGGAYASISGTNVSRIANGKVIVDITSHYGTKAYARDMVQTVQSGYKVWNSYRTGSLGKHIVDQVDAWLSGESPGDTVQRIYNAGYSPNADSPSCSRNTSVFTGTGFDCSAITFCTGGTGRNITNYPGILVTPRHALMALHTHTELPCTKLVWALQGGGFATANVVSYTQVGADTCVFYLDRDVQALGVPIMKVASPEFSTKLSTLSERNKGTPFLIRDLNTGAINNPTTNVLSFSPHFRVTECRTLDSCSLPSNYSATYSSWMSLAYAGDSGSPVIAPVNGSPVLLWMLHTAITGDDLSSYNTEINAALNNLAAAQGDGNSYSLSSPDLSAFTVY